MATTAAEDTWLTYILTDLHVPTYKVLILHCDNLCVLHRSVNPIFLAKTKHFEIDYHYVREQVTLHKLETKHVSSAN